MSGKTPGWDHFPFGIPGTPGYPIITSIVTQCLLFWIVKKWLIEVDHLPTGEMDAGPFTLTAAKASDESVFTRERDLVTAPSAYFNLSGSLSKYMALDFGADSTTNFRLKLYDSQGEVPAQGTWDDSATFGDDIDFLYHATPSEFWPYALRDGVTPVYDTATGGQINDPLESGVEVEQVTQNNGGVASHLNVLNDGSPLVAV